jgi:hypothetical protein
MQNHLARKIPVGTRVEKAQQILKSEGFNIVVRNNSSFVSEGQKVRDNINFVYGSRSDGFLFVHYWQVAILFKSDMVTEVLVNMEKVSP